MSNVSLPPGIPGIRALLAAYPETAGPLMGLAQAVLRGPSSLTPGERELLAAAVSAENQCVYCTQSHAATARVLLESHGSWVDIVLNGGSLAPLPAKLGALVTLVRKVARSGRDALPEDLALVRAAGADDRDIHDAVLVAAAFSLFNRYVDGLGAPLPPDPAVYEATGERLARLGYV